MKNSKVLKNFSNFQILENTFLFNSRQADEAGLEHVAPVPVPHRRDPLVVQVLGHLIGAAIVVVALLQEHAALRDVPEEFNAIDEKKGERLRAN